MASRLAGLVGQKLAGFQLTEMIGEGGMAAVFRGENLIDRSILRAIKVVQPVLASDEEFTKRFAEEARVLERLQHANVVRFFGARWEGEHLLMELELLQGDPLSAKLAIKDGEPPRLPVEEVVDWIQQASEGLAAAHELDIVHRDLKPDNLFLTNGGVTKVLDFGIARALDEADRASSVTREGTAPGTPAYLAPEVCRLGIPSRGSDVYAMGITLLELLLGYHPFFAPGQTRRSSSEVMFAHVSEELPLLRSVRPEAPEGLEQVVVRATAKDPDRRFGSARELADVLGVVLRGEIVTEVSVTTGEVGTGEHEAAPAPEEDGEAAPEDDAPAADDAATEDEAAPRAPDEDRPQTETPDVAVGVREPKEPASRGPGRWIGLAVAVLAVVGGILWYRGNLAGTDDVQPPPPVNRPGAKTPPPPARQPEATPRPGKPEVNPWIKVKPPASRVVLGVDAALYKGRLQKVAGFRPAAGVVAPGGAFELQQHEVTWGELDPWLTRNTDHRFAAPSWTPAGEARGRLPATGVPWATAQAYCRSLGGDLPTEEQWEYAARGPGRRPNPWGASPLDLARTRAYGGAKARPGPVMKADQDRTPGAAAGALFDLAGNAREWTLNPYRSDDTGAVEAWVQAGGKTFRAVRGLPLRDAPPPVYPREAAAFRDALCAPAATCPAKTAAARQTVGFRCARTAR